MMASGAARVATTFATEVQVITPLHVGTGETLVRDLDFTVQGSDVLVVDGGAVLADLPPEEWHRLGTLPLGQLAAPEDLARHARYRVALAGIAGGAAATIQELHPFIKDVHGRPYLPGSTLKGALRTALAVVLALAAERGAEWVERQLRMVLQTESRREFAAQAMERELFGPNPNRDLLRALRPSDLHGDGDGLTAAALHVVEVGVSTLSGRAEGGPRIYVEALPAGTRLTGTLTIDEFLFSDTARELGWRQGGKREALLGVVHAARELGRRLIERERHIFRSGAVAGQYDTLTRWLNVLDESSCLLWLGWGTGWTAKTLGELLLDSPSFEAVAARFRPRRGRQSASQDADKQGGDVPGRPFPASRRLALQRGEPFIPLGWVRLSMRPM